MATERSRLRDALASPLRALSALSNRLGGTPVVDARPASKYELPVHNLRVFADGAGQPDTEAPPVRRVAEDKENEGGLFWPPTFSTPGKTPAKGLKSPLRAPRTPLSSRGARAPPRARTCITFA